MAAPVDGSFRFLAELDNLQVLDVQKQEGGRGKTGQPIQAGIKARSDMNAFTLFFSRLRGQTVNIEIGNKTFALGRNSLEHFLLRNAAAAGIDDSTKKLSYDDLAKGLKTYLTNKKNEIAASPAKNQLTAALRGKESHFEVLGSYRSNYKLTPGEIRAIITAAQSSPSHALSSSTQTVMKPAVSVSSVPSGLSIDAPAQQHLTVSQLANRLPQTNLPPVSSVDDVLPSSLLNSSSGSSPVPVQVTPISLKAMQSQERVKERNQPRIDSIFKPLSTPVQVPPTTPKAMGSQTGVKNVTHSREDSVSRLSPAGTAPSSVTDVPSSIVHSEPPRDETVVPPRPESISDELEVAEGERGKQLVAIAEKFRGSTPSLSGQEFHLIVWGLSSDAKPTSSKDTSRTQAQAAMDTIRLNLNKLSLLQQFFLYDVAMTEMVVRIKAPKEKDGLPIDSTVSKNLNKMLIANYNAESTPEAQKTQLASYLKRELDASLKNKKEKFAQQFYTGVISELGIKTSTGSSGSPQRVTVPVSSPTPIREQSERSSLSSVPSSGARRESPLRESVVLPRRPDFIDDTLKGSVGQWGTQLTALADKIKNSPKPSLIGQEFHLIVWGLSSDAKSQGKGAGVESRKQARIAMDTISKKLDSLSLLQQFFLYDVAMTEKVVRIEDDSTVSQGLRERLMNNYKNSTSQAQKTELASYLRRELRESSGNEEAQKFYTKVMQGLGIK